MQSIRFSKELKQEFIEVFPTQSGYFSITYHDSIDQLIITPIDETVPNFTETFAKKYIQQEQRSLDESAVRQQRLERLRENSETRKVVKHTERTQKVYPSDAVLKEDIKQLYHYQCQLCSTQIKKAGWTEGLSIQAEIEFLSADAHHVLSLQEGGLDRADNIICVCPNCHRRLHTGELLIVFTEQGPSCSNVLTGSEIQITLDPAHSFANRKSL